MVSRSGPVIVLRRGLWARLAGGYWFQVMLSLALVVGVALNVLVFGIFGAAFHVKALLPTLPGLLTIVLVWGLGVTATASVDDEGIHYRSFRRHAALWSELDDISFTSVHVGRANQAAIVLTVGGRRQPIRPAYQCRQQDQLAFGTAIISGARRHGVPIAVRPGDRRWAELRAAQLG